jgi:hypothetical protein
MGGHASGSSAARSKGVPHKAAANINDKMQRDFMSQLHYDQTPPRKTRLPQKLAMAGFTAKPTAFPVFIAKGVPCRQICPDEPPQTSRFNFYRPA